jgi:ubiquinone/menaquinone biosynthesis C-methylase UbiE
MRLALARLFAAIGIVGMAVAGAPALARQNPVGPPQQEPDSSVPAETARDEPKQPKMPKRRPPRDAHAPWGRGVLDGTYMGRLIAPAMSYLGADWLLRPEREVEEEPERMLDALGIEPGMTVADVGAGVGYTSVRIAKRVGPTGTVLATDIQPQMIRMLRQNIRRMKLESVIKPILCTPQDPKLPEGQVDLVIMVDVYHECSHPVETLQGIRRALKPGGRLVLVEFRAEDPEVPIKPEHKMSVEQARGEVEPQGFPFVKLHDFLPWQHILVFEKPRAPDPATITEEPPRKPEVNTDERNEAAPDG